MKHTDVINRSLCFIRFRTELDASDSIETCTNIRYHRFCKQQSSSFHIKNENTPQIYSTLYLFHIENKSCLGYCNTGIWLKKRIDRRTPVRLTDRTEPKPAEELTYS